MKKTLSLIVFVLIACIGCNQRGVQPTSIPAPPQTDNVITASKVQTIGNTVFVESFKGSATQRIQAAVAASKTGDVIQLGSLTYSLDRPILSDKSVTFRGDNNTVITRPNADIKTLTVAADGKSTSLTLDNVDGIQVGDFIIIYTGQSWLQSSEPIVVRGVTGNVLTISPFYWGNGSPLSFDAGAKVVKSIGFFLITDFKDQSKTANIATTFEDITFDGNKAGNSESFRYNFNMPILSECAKRTTIRGCKFINAPCENILGHNMDILYNIFKNNNGSIYHASINKEWVGENEFMTNIIGNISDSSNLVSPLISGHSEGILTCSNSGGFVNATGNRFLHIGSDAAVIGALYPSSTYQDWGTSNYLFTGNIVNGATRLIYLINTTTKGYLGNVYINNNSLWNVGTYDYSEALKVHPEMVINQTNK